MNAIGILIALAIIGFILWFLNWVSMDPSVDLVKAKYDYRNVVNRVFTDDTPIKDPPCASSFGRIGERVWEEEGPPECEYLSQYDLKRWQDKKIKEADKCLISETKSSSAPKE